MILYSKAAGDSAERARRGAPDVEPDWHHHPSLDPRVRPATRANPAALQGRLIEGIRVTTEAGATENVGRQLTVRLGGPESAKALAEQAFQELF